MDITKRFRDFDLKMLKVIGKGTYGNVYLCMKESKNLMTVVKDVHLNSNMINNQHDNQNKELQNEVKILASLKHPNIIKFYECYYAEDHIMISMEYADKGNLAEFMYQHYPKMLKQKVILFVFSQILLGVHYIHDLNIIHRDLKAENILLSGAHSMLVKIGDFGISKMLASAKKTSTVIGTPYYLAPELCEGSPYDHKSDIWALGCLLYEMCTHKRAFEAETLVALVKTITSGSVHPIDLSIYDRGMQDLIDSMLSILPEKRPTIKELMAKSILTKVVYIVYLDAADEEMIWKACEEYS